MPFFPPEVDGLMQTLIRFGYGAYAVGGCVRDILLGKQPSDYDVTTDATPEEVLRLFGEKAKPTGLKHGTVTVGQTEVTTFRTEGAYADHRHPDAVHFTRRLEDDLCRRDFTVNAMAMDVSGRLTDLFGGQTDLQNGIIRAVGDPKERFCEDALRMLRALRFASVLGFSVSPETEKALYEEKELLTTVAGERVRVETEKLLLGDAAAEVLLRYPAVLGVVLPEILPSVGFSHRNPHHCYDVWEHSVRALAALPKDAALRWAMLFHDLGKPAVAAYDEEAGRLRFVGHQKASRDLAAPALARLRFSREDTERILCLVEWHDAPVEATPRSARRLLHRFGERDARGILEMRRADNLAQHPKYRDFQQTVRDCLACVERVLAEKECFSLASLAVRGEDVLARGYRGAEVGEELNRLLEEVIAGELPNEREALLAALPPKEK